MTSWCGADHARTAYRAVRGAVAAAGRADRENCDAASRRPLAGSILLEPGPDRHRHDLIYEYITNQCVGDGPGRLDHRSTVPARAALAGEGARTRRRIRRRHGAANAIKADMALPIVDVRADEGGAVHATGVTPSRYDGMMAAQQRQQEPDVATRRRSAMLNAADAWDRRRDPARQLYPRQASRCAVTARRPPTPSRTEPAGPVPAGRRPRGPQTRRWGAVPSTTTAGARDHEAPGLANGANTPDRRRRAERC